MSQFAFDGNAVKASIAPVLPTLIVCAGGGFPPAAWVKLKVVGLTVRLPNAIVRVTGITTSGFVLLVGCSVMVALYTPAVKVCEVMPTKKLLGTALEAGAMGPPTVSHVPPAGEMIFVVAVNVTDSPVLFTMTLCGFGEFPNCAAKEREFGFALNSAVLLIFRVTGIHNVPLHPGVGFGLDTPGAVRITVPVYVPGAIPTGDTATVKVAGVVVALGWPTSSHPMPLVVVADTVNPSGVPPLVTETVCAGGWLCVVWKLNVSDPGLAANVGLFEILSDTCTTCGLFPPPTALNVNVPV